MDTGGRPSRPIRPVPDIHDSEHTDKHVHALCHWEGEWSQFEEELREWKKFLDYRQKKETDGKTEVQLEERQSAESPTQVDLWKDYRTYLHMEVEDTKQCVEFWQQQVKHFQQEEDVYARQGTDGVAYRMHSEAENMQSHVEEARKQVGPAEMRLEWVEQQLSALLAECAVSATQMSTSDRLEVQAKLPKRASRSGQTRSRILDLTDLINRPREIITTTRKIVLQQNLRLVQSIHQKYQKPPEGRHPAPDDRQRSLQSVTMSKIKALT